MNLFFEMIIIPARNFTISISAAGISTIPTRPLTRSEEGQNVGKPKTIRVRCLVPMALRQSPNVAGFEVEAGASG